MSEENKTNQENKSTEEESIIEKHYGINESLSFKAEEVSDAIKLLGNSYKNALNEIIQKPFCMLVNGQSVLLHRGNAKPDLDDHTLDTAGYLLHGSPHLNWERPASKRAAAIHDKMMTLEPEKELNFFQKIFKGVNLSTDENVNSFTKTKLVENGALERKTDV